MPWLSQEHRTLPVAAVNRDTYLHRQRNKSLNDRKSRGSPTRACWSRYWLGCRLWPSELYILHFNWLMVSATGLNASSFNSFARWGVPSYDVVLFISRLTWLHIDIILIMSPYSVGLVRTMPGFPTPRIFVRLTVPIQLASRRRQSRKGNATPWDTFPSLVLGKKRCLEVAKSAHLSCGQATGTSAHNPPLL